MKTPSFWQSAHPISTLLLPLSALYGVGSLLHRKLAHPQSVGVPIICVGNLTAGGSGKTPVALAIGQWFKARGVNAFFLSRGYGGTLSDIPTRVDPTKHSANDVGDEPLLLAKILPTIVAKDRVAGAQYAIQQGAALIVMDDGFQHHAIAKDLSLLVVDGTYGFGNGRLIPAGPLRETTTSGFARAQAAVVINHGAASPVIPQNIPTLYATTQAGNITRSLAGKRVIAFCGIAYPDKFFSMLSANGANILDRAAFPDHHSFTTKELENLADKAQNVAAILVTTAKDAVRLPEAFRARVTIADVELVFSDSTLFDALLSAMLPSA